MLFNTIDFVIFLPTVFLLYWFITKKNTKNQNLILLAASYFFYACWDWRFLCLLLFSTLLDFWTGIKINKTENKKARKNWLCLSLFVNLGFLGIFKYYNFFAASFAEVFSLVGIPINPRTLKIILPVGISFYTFHGISYIVDIYYNRIKSERSLIDYAVFVSFFPLLVAGPIERATHLLPQIKKERNFDHTKFADGLRQILWGLFKKIVIADNCAEYVNHIFDNSVYHSGSSLMLGAILFSFQIYGDFSGYSDIAIGTARLFGIELLRNFAFPYFSRDIAEFWRRWHISLSSWFRDYLYIPLGGSKGRTLMRTRNIFIIFIISGFWHGPDWTFIAWGTINALFIIPSVITNSNRNNIEIVAQGKLLPTIKEFLQICITFILISFSWIFFRAESIGHAVTYINCIFSKSIFYFSDIANISNMTAISPTTLILIVLIFILIEWAGREEQHALAKAGHKWNKFFRYGLYYAIIIALFLFGGKEQLFIYFQF